jgi:hypothetical protein
MTGCSSGACPATGLPPFGARLPVLSEDLPNRQKSKPQKSILKKGVTPAPTPGIVPRPGAKPPPPCFHRVQWITCVLTSHVCSECCGNPPPLEVRLDEALPVRRLLDCDARPRGVSAPCGRRGRPIGHRPRKKCHRGGTLPPPRRGGTVVCGVGATGSDDTLFAPPVATVLRPSGAGLATGPFQGPS